MKFLPFRYFLTVAEYGTVRQAAEHLNVSASSITRQIQALEHEFGCELFERQSSGMTLTEEGVVLQKYMRDTFRELDLARDEIHQIQNVLTGRVKFSSIEGTVASWLFPAIASFRQKYPGVTFDGRVISSDAVYRDVKTDKIDFGIALLDEGYVDIDILHTAQTEFKIVMSPQHELADKKNVSLQDIAPHPLVMLNNEFYTRQLYDRLSGCNVSNIIINMNHIELIKHEVLANRGITILPDYACQKEIEHNTLRGFRLTEATDYACQTILFRKTGRRLTRASNLFLESLLENNTTFT